MQKISFKNWLIYSENAYTAGTAALAFTTSSDLRRQENKAKDNIKPNKAQKIRHLHDIIRQMQQSLPGKIQLFKNNLNNKMVHPIEPFTELLQQTALQNLTSFSDLDAMLEKTQSLVSQIEKTQLEKLDDESIGTIQKLINNIQQIISITEKPETDDEKKKNRDLRVIQMIDNDVVPYVHAVQQIMGYNHEI
jgi:hypothetical protein